MMSSKWDLRDFCFAKEFFLKNNKMKEYSDYVYYVFLCRSHYFVMASLQVFTILIYFPFHLNSWKEETGDALRLQAKTLQFDI